MSEIPLGGNVVCQVGLIVENIEHTVQKYCDLFGVAMPPIQVTLAHDVTETTYKGAPSDATAKLAFFDFGQVQIELIEPDHLPSVWRDYLDEHGESVHHIAFIVKNTGETIEYLAGHGIGVLQQGLYSDRSGMYTYMDSVPALGVMLELLENFPK
ncbi:VOC family protein [Aggregatilinea lenta]|uniref:VOC family protein n=1 Tax=Aggregatilinea lenta TaxID=913108 RepID=UPI000E5B5847|nr:VOC family protein [Aggregatilinea lenta]